MPGSFSVGSATVDIVPDARGFQQKLDAQLRNVQVKVDAVFDENGVRERIKQVAKDTTAKVKVETDTAGVRQKIEAVAKDTTAKVKVEADTAGAKRALAELQTDLKSRVLTLNVSTTEARAKIAALEAQIAAAEADLKIDADDAEAKAKIVALRSEIRDVKVDLDANTAPARLEIAKLRAEIAARKVNLDVGVDTDKASRNLTDFGASAGFASGAAAALAAAGATIGPAIVPAAGAAAAAILAIGPAAISSAAGIGVLIFGLKNVVASITARVKADQDASVAAVKAARTQAQSANQMAAAQSALAGAEAGLANARANAASAAKRAAQNIIDAQRDVRDAVQNASKSVGDAQERAADQVASAVARQVAAERTLAQSLLGEEQAQRSLSQARQQAKRDIEDLNNAVQDGQLSQRQAALDVQTTYDALVAAQDSGSRLERESAQLAYDRATQRQKELAQDQARLTDEKRTADKQGVEGSPAVQQAKRDLEAAKAAVKDAQTTFTAAQRAVTKARVDGQEAVAEATKNGARAIEDAERRLSDARTAQAEQRRQAAFSIEQAERGVESAQRGVQDASASAAAALAGTAASADKADQAYANLTKEGKALSDFFTDRFLPAFDRVRRRLEAPIAAGVLSGLLAAKPLVKPLTDLAENLAVALGHVAESVGKALGSPFWVDFFTLVGDQAGPATEGIATFVGNILTGIAGLMTAFAPFAKEIGGVLLDLSENFKNFGTGESGGLQTFLDFIRSNGSQIADDIGAIAVAIGNILIAVSPIGVGTLNFLGDVARSINDLAKTDPEKLQRIAEAVLLVIGGLTGSIAIVSAFTAIGTALSFLVSPVGLIVVGIAAVAAGFVILYNKSEPFRRFVNEKLIPVLKRLKDDALEGIREGMAIVKKAIDDNAPALEEMRQDFVKLVDFIVLKVLPLLGPILRETFRFLGQKIAEFITVTVLLYEAFKKAAGNIKRNWHDMVEDFDYMWNQQLKPIFQAIGTFVTEDVPQAFETGVEAIGKAWDGLKELAKKPIDFIVNTVLNDGILRAFRYVSDLVGYEDGKDVKIDWPPKGWSSGGYTGAGGKYDPRGIVHAGEVVFDQDAVAAAGGPLRLDAFRNALKSGTARLEGFAKGGIVWPTNTKRLSNNYAGHSGVDIAAGEGAPIYAATAGTIQYTGSGRGYGQAIFERAVNGLNMVYGHTSRILAKVGQMVQAGDHIGNVGHTGNASGPHLHFEVAQNGFDKVGNRAATLAYLGGAAINPSGTEPGVDRGFFAPVVDYVAKLKDRLTGPLDRLKEAGDSPWAQAMAGIPKLLVSPLLSKIRGESPSIEDGASGPSYKYKAPSGGEPLRNAAIIASVGSSMGRRAQIIGIATAIVESGLRNLSYGDRDSVGLFQQRSPWGSFAARTNPRISAGMFFHGGRGGQPGLDDIRGWQSLAMGAAAQRVQVSAFPGRYQERIGQATSILDTLKKAKTGKGPSTVGNTRIPSIYDNGGWLQPGTTVVHNNTGQPEPVFNPTQWRALERMASGGRGSGRTVNIAKVETADHRGLAKAIESEWALQDALYPSWG